MLHDFADAIIMLLRLLLMIARDAVDDCRA